MKAFSLISAAMAAPAVIVAPFVADSTAPLDMAMRAHAECLALGFDQRIAWARAFEAAAFADLDVLTWRGPDRQRQRINHKHERAGRKLMLAIAESEERARWRF
jgi:hypothetical protein